jgi:hypothetical protein
MGGDLSICEPDGLAAALDFDQIICCVDRPWPRAVLNLLAYRDYIPVIDGGIAIDVFTDGSGMRNATWRDHVLYPGRPCMSCIGQLDLGAVAADQSSALDDPTYITGGLQAHDQNADVNLAPESANVAVLSVSAAASILALYVGLNVAPGCMGEPGPLQYLLSTHTLEHLSGARRASCPVEAPTGLGHQAMRIVRFSSGQSTHTVSTGAISSSGSRSGPRMGCMHSATKWSNKCTTKKMLREVFALVFR